MLSLTNNIENYIDQHSQPESDLLAELNRQTHLKTMHPRMLSGHIQGRFLSMLSKMIQPLKILEIGTFTGYSALCMAEGLQENGQLITIEKDDEIAEIASEYFKKSNYKNKIKLLTGDALDILKTLKPAFDLVFIDADKKEYSNYYDHVIELVPEGGTILVDNVLWSGKVVEKIAKDDFDTQAIVEFNKMIQEDARVENVLLPIRDGLMVMRKK